MPTGHAQRLRLRLFLEGVEIPVIAANVQSAPNGPGMASIQIPPLAEGTRLHPRTLVHLFFLDMYTASSPFIDMGTERNEESTDPTEADKAQTEDTAETPSPQDSINRNYKLLFVGEVVGFEWTKNVTQRALVLQCADLSNYWDYAYQWQNDDLFGPGFKAVFSGGATNLFTDFLTTKGSVITSIVVSGKCNSFPKMKGLAAGIVRLIEAIGGTYFPRPGSEAKAIRGQNLFFSMAELRLRITQMVGAAEDDPTSSRIIARQGYSGMFDRALGGLGQQTSIRQCINALTKIVFHETYPQPCPLFVPGTSGEVSGVKRVKVKGHPTWGFVPDEAEGAIQGLNDVKAGLEELTEKSAELETAGTGTRSGLTALRQKAAAIRSQLFKNMTRLRGTPDNPPPSQAATIFAKAAQLIGVAVAQLESWRPNAPDGVKQRPIQKIDEAITQLSKAVNLTTSEVASKDVSPARLVQQILRPDIWFGAPPRCNVLFPESYDTLQFLRMFLQEPTRFLLKTNDEFFGEDALFDRYYFAPQAGNVHGDKTRMQDMLQGALLDHELFTGILPIFEKMGEFNVFANKSGTAPAKGPVSKAGPAQRSANFLYFKHRFNARKMAVKGKFNPWVAVGFPGLIIDKYVDVETIKLHNELRAKAADLGLSPQDVDSVLGTNFLGNFTQVVHKVSQQETLGETEIICSYSRQPEEGVQFLGPLETSQKAQKRDGEDAVRSTDVGALNPPRLFGFGPNLGRIINVQDVTEEYTTALGLGDVSGSGVGKLLPLFDIETSPKRRQEPTLVPIGITSDAELFGPEAVELTGDPRRRILFRAFRVTEEIPRYRQTEATVPIEELIRPGWYGDLWMPSKIGEVYGSFFGTGAITDSQTFSNPKGTAQGSATEDQHQAAEEGAQAEDFEDPRGDAPAVLALDEGATIQAAVEFLWLTYSYIKQQNLDVEEFIRAYTWRPIATMVDMFGTNDLTFTADGEQIVSGREGFHSRAFGPYDNLFGLTSPSVENILGIKRGDQAAQRADTRKEKLEKVQQYISALRFSRGLLG
jgi:hypothetical protein